MSSPNTNLDDLRTALQDVLKKFAKIMQIGSPLHIYLGQITGDYLLAGQLLKTVKALYLKTKNFEGQAPNLHKEINSFGIRPLLQSLEPLLKKGDNKKDEFIAFTGMFFELHGFQTKIKNVYTQTLFAGSHDHTDIIIDDFHAIWKTMKKNKFIYSSEMNKVRAIGEELTSPITIEDEEKSLLTQQVAEIVKNAVRHGNQTGGSGRGGRF